MRSARGLLSRYPGAYSIGLQLGWLEDMRRTKHSRELNMVEVWLESHLECSNAACTVTALSKSSRNTGRIQGINRRKSQIIVRVEPGCR